MGKWDEGIVCDVCHQVHHQISPACIERRRQREYEQSEEGKRALRENLAAAIARWKAEGYTPMPELRDLPVLTWAQRQAMGFPFNVPGGADEEADEA